MDRENLYNVAAMVYGEVGSLKKDAWRMAASTFFNRYGSNIPEWADKNPQEILQQGYMAVSNENTPYTQAITKNFPNKDEENKFKRILSTVSAMDKGTIETGKEEFFFTDKDIKNLKKNKSFNFDLVKKVGRLGKYHLYRYNP